MTDDASWEAAIGRAVAELGGLDILVNNAGVEISGLLVDIDAADVRRMLEVNVLGTALGIKHAFRAMRPGGVGGQRRRGRQHRVGGGHDRLPRHRRVLRDEVRRRPAHPGGGHGVRASSATASG